MKKFFSKIKWKVRKNSWKLYGNLSKKLQNLFPEEYDPLVVVTPCKDDMDIVAVSFRIPHHLTRKLMWSFKAWKEN